MLVPTCMIKFIELMLTVACLVLHHYSYDLTDVPTLMLCSGTYIGFIIVFSGEIVGEILFAPVDLVQDIFFGLIGMGLFSACGGLILSNRLSYQGAALPRTGDHNAAVLTGSLSVLLAVVCLFDFCLAYLDSEEFDDDGASLVSAAADAYVDAWWSASGGALFGACGWFTLHSWHDVPNTARKGHAQAAAVCALACASVLTIDALLAVCSAHKDDSSTRGPPTRIKPCTTCA